MRHPYTQLTLKLYRSIGVVVDIVEYWNSFAHVRKDLFGCIDIVGLSKKNHIIGIQSTSEGCRSEHRKKILAEQRIKLWLECGAKFHLVTWKKVKNRWKPRVEDFKKEQWICTNTRVPTKSVRDLAPSAKRTAKTAAVTTR